MKKTFILILLLTSLALSANSKKLTASQKSKLKDTLKIFSMAEKRPELWPAVLTDLRQFKATEGTKTIVSFFEGRIKNSLKDYEKKFEKAVEDIHKKIQREKSKEISEQMAQARKALGNANKESVSTSWGHMSKVKSIILPSASEVLKLRPELASLRKQLEGLYDMLQEFKDGDALSLSDFEEFTVSRMVPLADAASQKIMAANEQNSEVPLDIRIGLRDLNIMRLAMGKSVVAIDIKLCKCSDDHSKDMKEKGFFAHESPIPGKKSPWDRARNFGTTGSAENIAMGASDAKGAIRQWYHSPGHFKNMFGGHARVGLGRSGRYWTQMFGR